VSGYPSFTIFVNTEKQLADELTGYLMQGYVFDVGDATVTCSIHQNRLRDARRDLLALLTASQRSVYQLQTVISNLGVALNMQIDKHPSVFGNKTLPDNINEKLRYLGLECDDARLFTKHNHLNRFYNATKHAKSEENRRVQDRLNNPDGLLIGIDYFETIRRIFIWYYRKSTGTVPQWEELEDIPYSQYGVTYNFDYDRVWT
jgi:hypothetical protein